MQSWFFDAFFWVSRVGHVLGGSRGQGGFPFSVPPFPPLFSFFRWWCRSACVLQHGWGERKASGWILSHSSNKSLLSRPAFFFFFVQSANRAAGDYLPQFTPAKTGNVGKPRWLWRGLQQKEREARPGFCVFLLSSPVVLDVAEHSEVICGLSAALLAENAVWLFIPPFNILANKGT